MKKLLAFLLVALMLLPLAACGTNPPAVTDPVTDPITDAPETDAPITEPASVTLAKGYIDGIDARVAAILTTPTAVTYTGTAYYVAADGDDTADGLTPETAWATVARVNAAAFAEGDAVLFKRGDKFRTEDMIFTQKGVTYSAYGAGEKPMIMCSVDASDYTAWAATNTPNVYRCTIPFDIMKNVGGIIFDHGDAWGIRVLTKKNGDRMEQGHVFNGIEHYDSATGPFASYRDLKNNLEFYHDLDAGQLYLYCDYGIPDEVFESIEICDRGHGFGGIGEDVVIDNIAVFGTGSLCVGYDEGAWSLDGYEQVGGIGYDGYYDMAINLTVQNCAFYYNGGTTYIDYPGDFSLDYPLPYGDVVQALESSSQDVLVLNCSAIQVTKQCGGCDGSKTGALTLIGTTAEYLEAGLTAETAAELNVTDFSTAMHNPTSGYEGGHKRVLVTSDKVEDIIHLYADDERQTIEGFGAQSNNPSGLMGCSEEVQNTVLELLFDPDKGAGFTMWRMKVAEDESATINPAEGVWNMDAYPEQIAYMKAVLKYNPDAVFMAVPWSPPAWMKTNGVSYGQTDIEPKLREDCYDDMAELFVRWIKNMEENGIHIKYLTLQNEPTANVHYGCCIYTPEELLRLTNMVTARFKEEGITTMVCASDGAEVVSSLNYLLAWEAIEEGTVASSIAAITTHGYQYQHGFLNATNLERFGIPMFQTERSTTVGAPRPYTNQFLMRVGNEIYDHLQHNYSGYCFWWGERACKTLGDAEGDNSDTYDGESLFLYNPETGATKCSRDFYAMGQYSKFIRSGFVRVGATSLNPNLRVTCAKDPETGKLVTVVVNVGLDDYTVTLDGLSGASARLVRSGEGENWAELGDVEIVDGVATVTFKAQTVTTVVEQ